MTFAKAGSLQSALNGKSQMAFGDSKPMHVVEKLGVEIGNNSLKSPFFASCGI
jgi:hypothetical protein